ncbi:MULTISPECIES: hypothetical protein [Corynebacterium]|uniref:Secreted protein n=1 Tax=Corynebacterium lipophilum TaxID=2804918 RepID=A0AAW5HT92_9CORY|nr:MULTISPECIES: hypothetical protein [Corynebacterium]MCO6394615.1 hypothetical protein [Corynebacterium lipophilum]MCQ4612750.1 hypothetical protein [Corynebacterium sp. CCUG 51687]MCZ2117164.1 hypothetical protein [Corynebacterium lipophilum]
MKKIAAVALAATMTVGALAPTTGAETEKHPMDSYLISAPLGNKMVDKNTCKITETNMSIVQRHLDDPSEAAYFTKQTDRTWAIENLPKIEARLRELQSTNRSLLIQFYTGTTITKDEKILKEFPELLYTIESFKSYIACAKGENYEASFITQQSSKMTNAGRAATFWTPVALLIAGVLGAVALPTLKPMLPANIAAMLP